MRQLLLIVIGFIFCFLIYFPRVYTNTVYFHPDEFYWISTARIVPLVLQKNWNDPFWHEYYGYGNFNGAKWLYGIPFALAGLSDFSQFEYPPKTYYKYKDSGDIFPVDKAEYPYLFFGRLVALMSVSLSAGMLSLLAYMLTRKSVITGIAAGVLYSIHPLVSDIAIHAYADGFFLLLLLILCVVTELFLHAQKKERYILVVWGVVYAFCFSTKINAAVFLILFVVAQLRKMMLHHKTNEEWFRQISLHLGIIIASGLVTFLVLHPNIITVPNSNPLLILSGRAEITREHMAFFGSIDPSHVLWSLPERIESSIFFLFPFGIVGVSLFFVMISLLWKCHVFQRASNSLWILYNGIFVWLASLAYVVFREGRYFLPLLPFFILFWVVGIYELKIAKK